MFQSESDKNMNDDALDDAVTYDFIQEMAKTMGQGDRNHDMNVIMALLQVFKLPNYYLIAVVRDFARVDYSYPTGTGFTRDEKYAMC